MKSAKELLSGYLHQSQLLEAEQIHDFFSAWHGIAGENLAAHSRVKELEKGIVIVETDHPGWIQLLKMEERNLVRRLKQRFPGLDLKGMRFILAATGPIVSVKAQTRQQNSRQNAQGTKANLEKESVVKDDSIEGKTGFLQQLERLGDLLKQDDRND